MTTEEKAKAYDMALEAARKELGVDRKEWEVVQRVLHSIFPELRESEDERIRKALIQFLTEIKNISEGGRDSWHVRKEDAGMCDSFLSYLEKQKESLHIPETCEETAVSLKGEDEGIVNWLYDMLKRGLENAPKGCPDNPIAEKALAWLEKQKEPKHASDDLQKSFEEGQKSIVGNPERYGLCKKAEWSEEDERMRNGLISLIEEIKLRPLKRMEDWDGYTRFLKSLRPSWKPSEEQMETLKEAIIYVESSESNFNGSGFLLESLFNNLQKL